MVRRLDEESRASRYGTDLWTHPLQSVELLGSIKPFCRVTGNGGQRLNSWHHTDYQEQCRLQYFWGQLVKKLCYLALANSWGEVGGRLVPPPPSDASGWRPTFPASLSPYLTGQAYEQAAMAAAAPSAWVEEYIRLAKQEEPTTIVEPGIVADIDLANASTPALRETLLLLRLWRTRW